MNLHITLDSTEILDKQKGTQSRVMVGFLLAIFNCFNIEVGSYS